MNNKNEIEDNEEDVDVLKFFIFSIHNTDKKLFIYFL